MKIAICPPFEERIPPAEYGGTELVVYNLIEQLVKMGHEVTLIGTGDSQTSAKQHAIFKRALREVPEINTPLIRDAYKYIGAGKIVSYLNHNHFDIVHNHIGWRLLPFERAITIPMITTLYGPLDIVYQKFVYGEFPDANYVSISMSQRRPMQDLNFVANVYSGIETEKFNFVEKPQDYFVFLGRMSPEKGPLQAIRIAKRSGIKLVMAAKIDLKDEEYFKHEIEPLIDDEQIKFVGEITHDEKVKLLGNAKALLAPIQWEEPFGLFFIEAMICGTPVITMRRGSVPEIILDKKTGFICDSLDEATDKLKEVEKIDRQLCAQHVLDNFSAEKMTEGYLKAYEKVVAKNR
jgi:glycosyltransferase involved in cell wall biosynthesis